MNEREYGLADVMAFLKDAVLGAILFLGLFAITFVAIPNALTWLVGLKFCQPESTTLELLFSAVKFISVMLELVLFLVYTLAVFRKSVCEYFSFPRICNNGEHD